MTLHEIEETLHDLQSRHPGLSETLLVTLLRSGGWEEKNIQEALHLFRSGGERREDTSATKVADALPSIETESVFQPMADESHMLMEHNDDADPPKEEQTLPPEPQSLVKDFTEPVPDKKDELPHNLPLRPFETSEHIWPFARYKDVFYGEVSPKTEVKTEPQGVAPPPAEIPADPVSAVKQEEESAFTPPSAESKPAPVVHLAKGDERMVIMACIMLLAILLLLGYMYSNGRI